MLCLHEFELQTQTSASVSFNDNGTQTSCRVNVSLVKQVGSVLFSFVEGAIDLGMEKLDDARQGTGSTKRFAALGSCNWVTLRYSRICLRDRLLRVARMHEFCSVLCNSRVHQHLHRFSSPCRHRTRADASHCIRSSRIKLLLRLC